MLPRRRPLVGLVASAFLALAALDGATASAQSGATLTPDRLAYMVNKDLGGERWTISLNLASALPPAFLNATGNVFQQDGSSPTFVLCQLRPDSTGTLEDPASELRFTCRGTDACATSARDCARDDWRPISADVRIPADFFLPPGGNGDLSLASASRPGEARRRRSPSSAPDASGARANALPESIRSRLWESLAAVLGAPLDWVSTGPSLAHAQNGARGATLTYDGYNFLANKDLAGERWSISLNLAPVRDADGTFRREIQSLTGNVFKPDGSPPSFLYCTLRPDSTGTLEDPQSTFRLRCDGTNACASTAAECASSDWQRIADDIALPASFLLPPGGLPAPPQSDPDLVIIGRTSDPPSIVTPDFTLAESAAAVGGPAGAVCPVDATCLVEIGRCTSVSGRVVTTDGGCGCLVERVANECIACGGGASGGCGSACEFAVGAQRRARARGICLPASADDPSCTCYAIGAGQDLVIESCGGTVAAACPGNRCCVDDPRDGCDDASGVDCPGVCVAGARCGDPGDCVDASGTYAATNTSSGFCQTPAGEFPIPSGTNTGTVVFEQEGCDLTVRQDGQSVLTGTVDGNRITLGGGLPTSPVEGCSVIDGSQSYSGEIVGDSVELDGQVTISASCEFGNVSCELEVSIRQTR